MSRSVVILSGIPILLGIFFYLSVAWSVFGFPSMWEAWLLPFLMFLIFLPALGLFFTLAGIQRAQWITIGVLLVSVCMMFWVISINLLSIFGLFIIMLIMGTGYTIAFRRIREETKDRISYRPIKIIPFSLRVMGGMNLILVAFLVFLALQQNINLNNRELQLPESVFTVPVRVLDPAISVVLPQFSSNTAISDIIEAQISTSAIEERENVSAGVQNRIDKQKEKVVRKRIGEVENGLGISIENEDTVPRILQRAANQRLSSLLRNNTEVAAGTASFALLFGLWSVFIILFPLFVIIVRVEQALMFMTGLVKRSTTTVEAHTVEPRKAEKPTE